MGVVGVVKYKGNWQKKLLFIISYCNDTQDLFYKFMLTYITSLFDLQ